MTWWSDFLDNFRAVPAVRVELPPEIIYAKDRNSRRIRVCADELHRLVADHPNIAKKRHPLYPRYISLLKELNRRVNGVASKDPGVLVKVPKS